jgi:hypothetical protein
VAATVGLVDATAYGCAARDDDSASVFDDGLYDFTAEVVSNAAVFDADVLIDADGELCASGDGE